MFDFCYSHLGRDYGFKQAAGILVAAIFNLKSNPFGDNNQTQICSEIIYRILTEVFKIDWPVKDDDLVTPEACYNFLVQNYSKIAQKIRTP